MIKAVIFDMYETLITHFAGPLYFGSQMAEEIGLPEKKFREIWDTTDDERTIGLLTLEEVVGRILRENGRYSAKLFCALVKKRIDTKVECFRHLHEEIIPMLQNLKEKGILIGLISNCYYEEAEVIRESELFPYFDVACLSCELGVMKPNVKIYEKCMEQLGVMAEECLYVGDGGNYELETAESIGMKAVQAVWYLQEGTTQPAKRKKEFQQAKSPLEVLNYLYREEGRMDYGF
ncbi:MAG: HAD-IA family hydrolase [Lachnospiraceae bacterium]|nr:HAD-IA family hydrolase [Lachnospiraceae bacterium]